MSYLSRVTFVLLLVCALIFAQDNLLLAQTNAVAPSEQQTTANTGNGTNTQSVATAAVPAIAINLPPLSLPAASPASTSPAATPGSAMPPAPAPANPPQTSGAPKNLALITGLALTGVGVGLLAAGEPTHQTTCVTYGICPVPGAMHVTGGILVGVGVPLTILKLVKH